MAGAFVWHELMTSDAAAAVSFYRSVALWTAQEANMPGYTLLLAEGAMAAGIMAQPPEAGDAPPGWLGYVEVADVDASAAQAAGLGGQVLRPGEDIPGIGRFAVIADPQGAVLCLFQGDSAAEAPAMAPGRFAWNELMAADAPAVWPFYAALFGWTKGDAIDMGPMGIYQLFTAGGAAIGGMMTRPPQMPVAAWQFYIAVADIDAAVARVNGAGGQVLNGPMQVPGGEWVVNGMDPQGAAFGLVGARAG